ncbi:ATP-dependent helicase [Sphingobacterium daejeonense]|uniref:UvrD-helicase domain-containing protein n=1 Tax=Sphingobacterium daejeonense TaxID=371142 RepID=UPI0021A917F8|nr:ATP-dependent helicase [Sphingobacterium daejeonense]MCT1533110.1 ATP-dependent helicase [Sphingobacterium daejeonense]
MRKIAKESWIPADGMQLEANAMAIATISGNHLVVAGPGAGKTELLAQKASYLLQTNTCLFPYRILAISFKRDAAFNLKERVRLRCGEELSRRFDSLTFDSFAKQILDRFKQALPDKYKMNGDYDVVLADQTIFDYYYNEDLHFFNTTGKEKILNIHNAKLPHRITNRGEEIRDSVWHKLLQASPSKLSFKMIMQLAELIVASNPKIKKFLQQTYQFVFLDEFQDTTELQYDLFKTCFLNSRSYFTAVGDDKQRIMLWAGAKNNIFEDFITDTKGTRVPLNMNFRCAPRLVTLLNHLTQHLLHKSDFATPSPKWKPDEGECSVLIFKNPEDEMQSIFLDIKKWTEADGVNSRDICILVKQQLNNYAGSLIKYFNQNGIKARDENKFQDLLTQEVCLYIIDTLYNIFSKNKENDARKNIFNFLSNLHTEMEDNQLLLLDTKLSKFISKLKKKYSKKEVNQDEIINLIEYIVDFADKDRIQSGSPQYKNKALLNQHIKEVEDLLIRYFSTTKDIILALDMLMGKNTIPVMTIHKSKGLEYHTVIFIGLEDGAFWSFDAQPDEDKCAFFVALSRAKERVVFTFSHKRQGKFGLREQSYNKIQVLFQELNKSGVVSFESRVKNQQ